MKKTSRNSMKSYLFQNNYILSLQTQKWRGSFPKHRDKQLPNSGEVAQLVRASDS